MNERYTAEAEGPANGNAADAAHERIAVLHKRLEGNAKEREGLLAELEDANRLHMELVEATGKLLEQYRDGISADKGL